jgi:HJR/Mrr/RecB family endonuclease
MQPTNAKGILKEIKEQYPNIDLPGYLADNLQLPMDKAEVLAARIQKQIGQKASDKKGQKTLRMFEKSTETETLNSGCYQVDCLSEKEFEYFTQWLLGELGYENQPEKFAANEFGFDGVVAKDGEKVAVQAIRCPKTHKVTDASVLFAQEMKGECQKALLISTGYFSEQAKAAADKLGFEFWDIDTIAQKIVAARERVDLEVQACFPKYKGALLESLLGLGETKNFLVEAKAEGKYEVHLPGVKYPLLTFQSQNGGVSRCVFRIKYNEPVGENDGEALISTNEAHSRIGPDDEQAYGLIMQYLEQFLE